MNFPSKKTARPVAPPMVSNDGVILSRRSRLINRGASWNTQGPSREYLRAAGTDDEMSDMRYPSQGFRTFRSAREVKP